MTNDPITDYVVTDAMLLYGGAFVSGLGRLYRLADVDNQHRLKQAFSEYFEEYTELVRRRRHVRNLERVGKGDDAA